MKFKLAANITNHQPSNTEAELN